MKPIGIIRKIDDFGRIVLPKELRRTFDMKTGDFLEIYTDKDNTIILKKYFKDCIFCGSDENLKTYEGKVICQKCIDKIRSNK